MAPLSIGMARMGIGLECDKGGRAQDTEFAVRVDWKRGRGGPVGKAETEQCP
jgi:hypothetical protein